MALPMTSHARTNTQLSLRPSHSRRAPFGDDAFSVWPDVALLERDPFVCFADGDDDDDSSSDDKKPKTFTQEDLDRIVSRRLKKEQSEREALTKKVEELTAALEDSKVDDNGEKVSPTKKLERELERERAKNAALQKAADEAKAGAEKQVTRLKAATMDRHALAALTASGALPGASKHALSAFLADAKGEVEFDDEGGARFVVHVGGVPFEDDGSGVELGKAAAKWLADNKHFAKAAEAGGGGGGDPRGKGGPVGKLPENMNEMSVGDLLTQGFAPKTK